MQNKKLSCGKNVLKQERGHPPKKKPLAKFNGAQQGGMQRRRMAPSKQRKRERKLKSGRRDDCTKYFHYYSSERIA